MNRNKEAKFDKIASLKDTKRQKIDLKELKKFMPVRNALDDTKGKIDLKAGQDEKNMTEEEKKAIDGYRNMKKWDSRFTMMYMNTKSTAKKMRILIKKSLFLHIASVIIAIQKMKFHQKEMMKKDRLSLYRPGEKKEAKFTMESFLKDPNHDSMLDVTFRLMKIVLEEDDKENPFLDDIVEQPKDRSSRMIPRDIANALSRSVRGFGETSELKMNPNPTEPYKGKVAIRIEKFTKCLLYTLTPFSFMINAIMPNLEKPRDSNAKVYIIYGLFMGSLVYAMITFVIVWFQDALFKSRNYPSNILGLLINSTLITIPHLLYNLSIIEPKKR